MNERIKELAEQSTKKLHGFSYRFGNTTETYFDEEKFAELIVRECARVILDKAAEYPDEEEWYDWTNEMNQAHAEIIVHFGVEE